MYRRQFLAAAGSAVGVGMAGCITTSSGGDGGSDGDSTPTPTATSTATPTPTPDPTSSFQGPETEDQTYVDVQHRDYTAGEIEAIKAAAETPTYDELFRNIDANRGRNVQFEATIGQTIPGEDSEVFYFFVFLDNDVSNQAYVSWTGDRFIEEDVIRLWGQVLGPETYETGAGSSNTVPAIAAADIELQEETATGSQ